MCGITGFVQRGLKKNTSKKIIKEMTDALYHRGPNDKGYYYDFNMGLAFGHRRLSILDLSKSGHQPMSSKNDRYTIVYNGEIYNYNKLKTKLINKGYKFKGDSDTEVLIESIDCWGITDTVKKLNGMFAFAVYDKKKKVVHLVRDRVGIKPLYYGLIDNTFVFASELKAIKKHPSLNLKVNRDSLSLLMKHNYIPAPYSIYKDIKKLKPGNILEFDCNNNQMDIQKFWDIRDVIDKGLVNRNEIPYEDAISKLDYLLKDAVKKRMIADVPLGAFLSGGIDSTTVVALMQQLSSQPVKTFSIGFGIEEYNEAPFAKEIAQYLDTDHTELYINSQKALDVIPKLPELYDEPFSDSSQIPTFLVSELTKKHVTVSLSGDGGDELFCGYNRYMLGRNIKKNLNLLPDKMQRLIGRLIKSTPDQIIDFLFSWTRSVIKKYGTMGKVSDKLNKLSDLLFLQDSRLLYDRLISHWNFSDNIVLKSAINKSLSSAPSQWKDQLNFLEHMMFIDFITYLVDDILVKVDRASMGVSLEARVPLLDHRVVEYAWSLPLKYKIKNNRQKWILKQVLYQYVPERLMERPKKGFGVPIGKWLKGPLRPWVEELINKRKLKKQGFLNYKIIRDKWQEHLEGKRDWKYYLWDVLMFQAWLEKN